MEFFNLADILFLWLRYYIPISTIMVVGNQPIASTHSFWLNLNFYEETGSGLESNALQSKLITSCMITLAYNVLYKHIIFHQ